MSAGAYKRTGKTNTDYPKDYQFGIELEYRMLPEPKHLMNKWNRKMKDEPGFFPICLEWPDSKRPYVGTWRLMDEWELDSYDDGRKLLEIVSPMFRYSDFDNWERSIKLVIGFFVNNANLDITRDCAFHIHVSPIGCKWDLDWLRHVADAVVVFDKPMRDLHRIDKKVQETFCRSNRRSNPKFKNKDRGQIRGEIARCMTVEALINLINAKTSENPLDQRNYAWNFTGTSRSDEHGLARKNTIEYRSPRATTNTDTIIKWIVFAVRFVHASIAGGQICNEFDDDLDSFLQNNCPDLIGSLSWKHYQKV